MYAIARKILAEFEGFRSAPYLDVAGVPTIGFGSTYYENGVRVSMLDAPITRERAEEIKEFWIRKKWNEVQPLIKVALNDNQKAAVLSLVYNIGVHAFAGSTVLRTINNNPNDPYIKDAFLMWRKAGGKVVQGLITRREKEVALYFKKKVKSGCICPCSC